MDPLPENVEKLYSRGPRRDVSENRNKDRRRRIRGTGGN